MEAPAVRIKIVREFEWIGRAGWTGRTIVVGQREKREEKGTEERHWTDSDAFDSERLTVF
jgi:hypothetical protein